MLAGSTTWEIVCFLMHKGDNVRLNGYFQNRTYEKDGETESRRFPES